jgi:hypothetical protein
MPLDIVERRAFLDLDVKNLVDLAALDALVKERAETT